MTSTEASYLFPNDWMMKVVERLLFADANEKQRTSGNDVLQAIATTANEMDDVRFYLYKDIGYVGLEVLVVKKAAPRVSHSLILSLLTLQQEMLNEISRERFQK